MISKNLMKFVKQLEMKKHRQREGLFVAEGPKVVGDLLTAGFNPQAIYATGEWMPNPGQYGVFSCTSLVSPDELRKLSFLQHPQQVLAVFRLPSRSSSPASQSSSLTLALDGIQDPGNLGTIIRIADWFGIGTIVCSPDTADCWNPKVVQATMGSIARVNMFYTPLTDYLQHTPLPVCGTLLDGQNIYTQQLPSQAVIVMGNEGNGISPAVRQLVTHPLLIPPFRSGAESLNVAIATAITCSEFCRRKP